MSGKDEAISPEVEKRVRELEERTGKKYTVLKGYQLPADRSQIYRLGDVLVCDPFEAIFQSKKGSPSIHDQYVDYKQYLDYLRHTWKRLQDDYQRLYNTSQALTDEMLFDPSIPAPVKSHYEAAHLIQMDTEIFIMFSNRFMDKVAKLIERLIKPADGKRVKANFEHHRAFFTKIESQKYNPEYSEYLRIHTAWYDMLTIMRDKLIEHGKSFNDTLYVSQIHGIMHLKTAGALFTMSEEDAATLDAIRSRYSELSKVLRGQPWRILRHIMKSSISMSRDDVNKVAEICTRAGGSLDATGMAKNIERFLEDTSKLVKHSDVN